MIDRAERRLMASTLRQLLARQMTNDEFACSTHAARSNRVDRALGQISEAAWWGLYSNTHEYTLERGEARESRQDVARWVLFLQTDLEYRWPPLPWDEIPIVKVLLMILTLGLWQRLKLRRGTSWAQQGDVSVWPFLSREELDRACQSPRFLVGSS